MSSLADDAMGAIDHESIEERIAKELANAAGVVEELERDAVQKGVRLKLSGARYKIYQTITD